MAGLTGKTALVTGASRGIGRDVGGDVFTVRAELDRADGVNTLLSVFDRHADGLDILVNNAGILGGRIPYPEVSEATYDELFAVNTRAPFFLTQAALPRIRDNSRIVNISTRFTHGSRIPELMTYTMSKAAIDAFTSTLAKALAVRGITVNAVGPGSVDTDMNAARLSSAEGRGRGGTITAQPRRATRRHRRCRRLPGIR